MGNWYNFLIKTKPGGKAFRSIEYSKIFYEMIENAIEIVRDYFLFNINDQVWYVSDNFDPEPWERRYEIEVPEFSTLPERRQVVKSYMLFPQYQNRLSLDYFNISLLNAGYDTVFASYNTISGGASTSNIRMTTVTVNAGEQIITIPKNGYSNTSYEFSFQAYDLNGFKIFAQYITNDATTVTIKLNQAGIITLTTLLLTLSDPLRITTQAKTKGIREIVIPYSGYADDVYYLEYQAYDSNGFETPIQYLSKSPTGVTFNLDQDSTVILTTLKPVSGDSLKIITELKAIGDQEIVLTDSGYTNSSYDFQFQAYDNNGLQVYPIYKSRSATGVTLEMPQEATVTLKTFKLITVIDDNSYMHANDSADEKAKFNIGPLVYNSFIVEGEIAANLYKNVIYLLMSLKPPQVVMYDKIEVLQAIALDDNLAIALDDNLAIAITTI